MKIGKIVGSNSHIDYVARIGSGELDVAATEYGFGQFVAMDTATDRFVGVVYDSRLINPEFSNFGPRLQPRPAIDEPSRPEKAGILIGIILLGTMTADTGSDHSIPIRVIPVGTDVETIAIDAVNAFHSSPSGEVHLGYYQRIIANSGQFAVPLLESIIERLQRSCTGLDRERLAVLRDSLKWRSTFA